LAHYEFSILELAGFENTILIPRVESDLQCCLPGLECPGAVVQRAGLEHPAAEGRCCILPCAVQGFCIPTGGGFAPKPGGDAQVTVVRRAVCEVPCYLPGLECRWLQPGAAGLVGGDSGCNAACIQCCWQALPAARHQRILFASIASGRSCLRRGFDACPLHPVLLAGATGGEASAHAVCIHCFWQ
jgi:hypothetical protein